LNFFDEQVVVVEILLFQLQEGFVVAVVVAAVDDKEEKLEEMTLHQQCPLDVKNERTEQSDYQ
jgi:hypothetical protein